MHPSSTQPADQIGNAHSAQPANNSNTARQKRKPRNPPWFDPHNPGLGGEAAGPPPDGRVGLIGIDENESTQVGDEPLSFDEEDGDTNEDRTREFGLGQNDQTNEREQPHGHCDDDRSVDPEAARLVALQSLYASLYVKEKPINGTWIPTWLVRATGTEARAAVLAELLWWFEPAFSDARRQERASSSNRTAKLRARARVYDAGGLQWLAISIRRLAARTMLSASTTAGALRWLKSEGLLAVEPGKNRIIRIRPNGRAIAQAFFSATHSEVAQHEFLHPDATRTEWTGSMTQSEAMHRAPGVTVHNVFVSAFGGDHFRARLLCQILFRFLDRRGHCAAVTKIGDEVWWVTTDRQLAEELGVGAKKVRRGLDALIRDGLVHKLIRPSGFRSGGERRWVVHLRPDMPNIQRVIESFHGTAAPSSKGETL